MLDKIKVKQRFAKATATYEEQALVQKKICVELAEFMGQFIAQKQWRAVLEIGCGTGLLTREVLKSQQIDSLYLNDLYNDVADLDQTIDFGPTQIQPLIGDIEQLELPQYLDLVMSSSAFQWMTDFPALLKKMNRALKPQGYLVFSSFAPDNLKEIKQLTGCGLNYLEPHRMQQMLMDAGFEIVMMKNEVHLMYFEHPRAVLQHLKETGVTATGQHRWTKTSLQQFYQDYEQFALNLASDKPRYPLTYSPIQCIVRKK